MRKVGDGGFLGGGEIVTKVVWVVKLVYGERIDGHVCLTGDFENVCLYVWVVVGQSDEYPFIGWV